MCSVTVQGDSDSLRRSLLTVIILSLDTKAGRLMLKEAIRVDHLILQASMGERQLLTFKFAEAGLKLIL